MTRPAASHIYNSRTSLLPRRRIRDPACKLGVVRRRRKLDIVALICALVLGFVAVHNRELGRWHCYVTNRLPATMKATHFTAVYAARWDVELLLRELKSVYRRDQMPSANEHVTDQAGPAVCGELLGPGPLLRSTVRTPARAGLGQVVPIACTGTHTCALDDAGELTCWDRVIDWRGRSGYARGHGQSREQTRTRGARARAAGVRRGGRLLRGPRSNDRQAGARARRPPG